MSDHSAYISPFSTRYASKDMQFIFSEDNKFRTWRKLWVALAKAEKAQGLAITDEQIAELEAHWDDINYEDAQRRERECRHDVMSHVYAYGLQCPKAKGILHLGATSCYVGDNTDVIIMKQGLQLIRRKVLNVLDKLAKFADEYKAMPCLAYTHIQPAQLTTVGKRATLWMNELYMDYLELEHRLDSLALLGSKGTTGTQASFMELFGGDEEKIRQLERDIAQQMGFDRVVPVSGQTYSRKMDYFVVSTLSGIAQTRQQIQLRSPAAAKLQGDGGTFRKAADRFLGHALQAQSHAFRTYFGPEPLRHGGHFERRHHQRHAVFRAYFG